MTRLWNTKTLMKVPVLGTIFFIICILHNVLYNMKDALVITAKGSGAEVIPFIQLWLLLPFTCAATFGLAKLLSRRGLAETFQIVFLAFMAFFVFFACLLYPFRDVLRLDSLADAASRVLPVGLQGFVAMGRHWILSLFFVVCELWAGMVTSVMFWSLANEITPVSEAQKSYSWIRVSGAIGSAFAGQIPATANWLAPEVSVYVLLGVVITGCMVIVALFHWMSRHVLDEEAVIGLSAPKQLKRTSYQGSLWEQLRSLLRTKYMVCLAIVVIGYNLYANLFELVWKAQLKELYPDFNGYNAVLGYASTICGILTFVLALVVPKLLERKGWTFTALICPVINLVTSTAFFGLLLFQDLLPFDQATIMGVAVYLGAVQFSLGRATKHSVFDVTKDMAYIPLDSSLKAQGKAVVDGLGSRAAKSGASLIHQTLIVLLGTVGAGMPIIAGVVILVGLGWMGAVHSLGRQFNALVGCKEEEREVLPVAA